DTYQIKLNWLETSGQILTGFNVYRCVGCASPRTGGVKIASLAASVFTFTDGSASIPLKESTTYTYQVTALSHNGESGLSNADSEPRKTEPASTNLGSFAFERGGIDDVVELHWTNNATDDDSYFLESCKGPTCPNFNVIAQLGANSTSDIQGFQFAPD